MSQITVSVANSENWKCSSNYVEAKVSTRRSQAVPKCEFKVNGLFERMTYTTFLKISLVDGFKYKLNKVENKWFQNSIINPDEAKNEEPIEIPHILGSRSGQCIMQNGISFEKIFFATKDHEKEKTVVLKTLRLYKISFIIKDENGNLTEFHDQSHKFVTISPPPSSKRKVTEDGVQEPKVKRSRKNQNREQCRVMRPVKNGEQNLNVNGEFPVKDDNGNNHVEYQNEAHHQEGQEELHHGYYEDQIGFVQEGVQYEDVVQPVFNQSFPVVGYEGYGHHAQYIAEPQQQEFDPNQYYGNYEGQYGYSPDNIENQGPMDNYEEVAPMENRDPVVRHMDVLASEEENVIPEEVQYSNEPTTQLEEEDRRKSFEGCSEEEREILGEFLVL